MTPREKAIHTLRSAWAKHAPREFSFRKTDAMTGEEVRQYMRVEVDSLTPRRGISYSVATYLHGLTEEAREAIVSEAFPDGDMYRKENDRAEPN